ncbi:hypothetical protein [Aminipila luticellarii]|uniref:hypothetical protein n=1 Tax=Aminipila luticellarii TaxID=2507160 RepID=UPI0013E8B93F|nr:hypothetical protein [Aminipila luticellarii]
MKKIFSDWNYKKHAKWVTAIYAVLYAIDMTLTYFIIKRIGKNDCAQGKSCKAKS